MNFFLGRAREFGDRAIDRLFIHVRDFLHRQLRLAAMRRGRFLVAFDELAAEPAENVIRNAGRAADVGILGETARLETLVGEFLHQAFERHAVLQSNRGERADRIHQAADGAAFLRHRDEEFARHAVFEKADRDVAFVARDLERCVSDMRVSGMRWRRLVDCRAATESSSSSSRMRASELGSFETSSSSRAAHVFGFSCIQRSGALRAVAIHRDRFQTEPPAFDVGVHDFINRRRFRHVDGLRNRSAQERLRRRHHAQMRHVA